MKIYLSSLGSYVSDGVDTVLASRGTGVHLLGSFANDRDYTELVFNDKVESCQSFMLDSGAVSVRAGLAEVSLVEYIQYIKDIPKEVKDKYEVVSVALDVIGDSEKSFTNYMKMKEEEIDFLPVFHYNEDLKYLERLIDEGFTYIGLGGTHSKNSRKAITYDDFLKWWSFVFFTTDDKGQQVLRYPGVDYHGFAVTSMRALSPFPWRSVDSTTWVKMAAYGKIMTPWGDIRVSNHINAAKCRLHVDRRDPLQQQKIRDWCEAFGFTLEQAAEERVVRNTINVLYFLWLQDNHKWIKKPVMQQSFLDLL